MNLSIPQPNLARGLSIVSRAVAPRAVLPALSHTLLVGDYQSLRLSATDLELTITAWVEAQLQNVAPVAAPAKLLSELVSTLPADQPVHLSLDPKTLALSLLCGHTTASLKCLDADEFPPVTFDDESVSRLPIEAAALKSAISQVAFAASSDAARPILTGILVSAAQDKFTLAAADGFRLSQRTLELAAPVAAPFKVIVPARALTELARLLPTASEGEAQSVDVFLRPNNTQIVFRLPKVELVSQLINGDYPDYEQIIPRRHTTQVVLPTADFLTACRQVAIFARDGNQIARLAVTHLADQQLPEAGLSTPQPGQVEVSGQAVETGASQTIVPATLTGESLTIGFNVNFVRDVLAATTAPEVTVEFSTSTAPGVWRSDFTHVIMPMLLPE